MHSPDFFTAGNGALAVAVGAYALWKFPRNVVNQALAIFTGAIGVWAIALVFDSPLLIGAAAASLAIAANFHFTQNLIGNGSAKFGRALAVYAGSLGLFVLLAINQLGFLAIPASGEIWFAGMLAVLFLPIFMLLQTIGNFSGIKKYQLKFVLFEYILALTIGSANFIMFWHLDRTPTENFIATPHILGGMHIFLVFYLLWNGSFLKLKIIAPEILKKALAFAFATAIAILVSFFNFAHSEIFTHLAAIVTAIVIYTLTLRFFDARNWFAAVSLKNFQRVVEAFKNQNIFYASLAELEENIRQNFSRKIGIDEARVIVLDLENGESQFPQLEKYFAHSSRYLVTTEEDYLAKNKHIACPYLDELRSLGDVCFPLFQNTNELIGFLVIRRGNDNDIYVEEELKLLEGGVHYIALSLMAILYTEKLRRQAARLREDYEKLKTLDNAKDSFIANVSHELRTPATAIKGYADLLAQASAGELNEKQRDFTNRIERNTNWLLSLLTDILEITQLESEQIRFSFETVRARDLLEKLAKKWKKACQAKKLKFEFEFATAPQIKLQTDPVKLTEILERLLGNALKFTERGGVALGARTGEGFLEIEVRDTGIGIPPEKIERMWDKFSQSADFLGKSDQSAGLGLAIVKKLVENLSGKISVQSKLGQGSTFQL